MVLISKTSIQDNLIIKEGLKQIYGINNYTSMLLCSKFGLNPFQKIKKLKNFDYKNLSNYIDNNFIIGVEKKKQNFIFIKKNLDIKNFKGLKIKLKR